MSPNYTSPSIPVEINFDVPPGALVELKLISYHKDGKVKTVKHRKKL